MITKSTIAHVKSFMKPAAEAGLIPPDQYRELLTALRHTANPPPAKPDREHLLRTADVAELLNCCDKTVLRLGDRGRLTKVYLTPGNPKSLRFRAAEVDAITTGEG